MWEDGSFIKLSYFNVISECCYLYSLDIQSKVYSNGKLYTCLQLALVFKTDPMSTIIIPSNMIKYDKIWFILGKIFSSTFLNKYKAVIHKKTTRTTGGSSWII